MSNNGFLFSDPPVPGWFPTGLASLIVGFVVYAVLAKAGLESKVVELPGSAQPAPAPQSAE